MSKQTAEAASQPLTTDAFSRALDEYVAAVMDYSRALDDLLDRDPGALRTAL